MKKKGCYENASGLEEGTISSRNEYSFMGETDRVKPEFSETERGGLP